ncbi:MAG TPA: transcription termination factor NusA [Firmicutes bacterium]|nr:transcription termination factor NusA [Bacillota bacterium]
MKQNLLGAIEELVREKEFDIDFLVQAIKDSIVSGIGKSYKKKSEEDTEIPVSVEVNVDLGSIEIFITKTVVEVVANRYFEISLDDAKKFQNVNLGDEIVVRVNLEELDRSIVLKIKQLLISKIRKKEQLKLYKEFQKSKLNTVVTGTVQSVKDEHVILDLGSVVGHLYRRDQIPGERYRIGDKKKVFVYQVNFTQSDCEIKISRSLPELVKALFEMEVPEIQERMVEIVKIARIPGKRTKIAVRSTNKKIDPAGACIGVKGSRIKSIKEELGEEKIDVFKWTEDVEIFLKESFKPVEILSFRLFPEEKRVRIVVADDKLAMVIGTGGNNIKLTSRLLNWQIDAISESELAKTIEEENLARKERLQYFMSIPGVGEKTARELIELGYYSLEKLSKLTEEDLLQIPGIGKKASKNILKFVKEELKNLEKQKEAIDSEKDEPEKIEDVETD